MVECEDHQIPSRREGGGLGGELEEERELRGSLGTTK